MPARRISNSGSTLFIALIVLAALSFMAAYTFQRVSPGVRVAYQNAAWQEARRQIGDVMERYAQGRRIPS